MRGKPKKKNTEIIVTVLKVFDFYIYVGYPVGWQAVKDSHASSSPLPKIQGSQSCWVCGFC